MRIPTLFAILAMSYALQAPGAGAQASTSPIEGADDPERRPVVLGIGLGAGTSSGSGPAGRVSLSFPSSVGQFSVRVAGTIAPDLWSSPWESAWDVGVLYGRRQHGRWANVALAIGVGLVGGTRRGAVLRVERGGECSMICFGTTHYERIAFRTIGIPMEVELGLTPFRNVGVGLSLFANLNPSSSFVGASINLLGIDELR